MNMISEYVCVRNLKVYSCVIYYSYVMELLMNQVQLGKNK